MKTIAFLPTIALAIACLLYGVKVAPEMASLRTQLAQRTIELNTVTDERDSSKTALKKAVADLERVNADLEDAKDTLGEKDKSIDFLKGEIDRLNQQVQLGKDWDKQAADNEVTRLQSMLKSDQRELRTLQLEHDQYIKEHGTNDIPVEFDFSDNSLQSLKEDIAEEEAKLAKAQAATGTPTSPGVGTDILPPIAPVQMPLPPAPPMTPPAPPSPSKADIQAIKDDIALQQRIIRAIQAKIAQHAAKYNQGVSKTMDPDPMIVDDWQKQINDAQAKIDDDNAKLGEWGIPVQSNTEAPSASPGSRRTAN